MTKTKRITKEDIMDSSGVKEDSSKESEAPKKEQVKKVSIKEIDAIVEKRVAVEVAKRIVPAEKKVSKEEVDKILKKQKEKTKTSVDKAPKVRFMIPLLPGEKKGAVHEVGINGYNYFVKKGVFVDLPKPVADLLANYYDIEESAGEDLRIDGDPKKQEALA